MEQAKVTKTAHDRRQLQLATDAILDGRDLLRACEARGARVARAFAANR
jgi:hypothetical protein